MVYLIGQTLTKNYFAPILSKASCFCFFIYIGALVISYLMSFGTKSMFV